MSKKMRTIIVLGICLIGMSIGVYLMKTPPVTRIYSEKVAICDNEGLCSISSLQRYSNGAIVGSSSDGISEDWVRDWLGNK